MSVSASPSRLRHVNWSRRLLRRCGLPERTDLMEQAGEYRRWRLWGATAGPVAVLWLVGGEAILGEDSQSVSQRVVFLLTMFFIVAGGMQNRPGPQAQGAVRTASLAPRHVRDLLPPWAVVLPYLTLLPCLLAPLWEFIAEVGYPNLRAWYVTVPALLGLAGHSWALRSLLRRRLQASDSAAAHLDMVTRSLTARRNATSAAALGFVLLAALNTGSAERWGPDVFNPAGWAALVLALALVPIGEITRFPRRLGIPSPQRSVLSRRVSA